MASYEILPLFGLQPSSPIPPDFSGRQLIDGVWVVIYPKGTQPRTKNRRVLAQCPLCHQMVCAGHLHQHLKGHKRLKTLEEMKNVKVTILDHIDITIKD